MKAVSAKITPGLNLGSTLVAADNSGAKIVRLVSVKRGKGKKGKQGNARVADMVKVSIRKGVPDMNYGLGDLFINISVKIPKNITLDEKYILEKLKNSKNFEV